jgi:hypothetical protein
MSNPHASHRYGDQQVLDLAFVQRMVGGQISDCSTITKAKAEDITAVCAFLHLGQALTERNESEENSLSDVMLMHVLAVVHRPCFISDTGHIGVCPATAIEVDQIFV